MIGIMQRNVLHSVLAVTFSLLLSACQQAETPAKSWQQAAKGTLSAAFSSDGRLGFIGSISHGGSLWRLEDGERLFNWNHSQDQYSVIYAAAFSADDSLVATTEYETIVLWDAATGKSVRFWHAPARIMSIDLSPKGDFALLGLDNHTAVLFDIMAGGITRTLAHAATVTSVALNKDGSMAVTGSDDFVAKVWSVESGALLATLAHTSPVNLVAISNSGQQILTGAYREEVVIWNSRSGESIHTLFKTNPGLTVAVFSRDGSMLLTGNAKQHIQLWDTQNWTRKKEWQLEKAGQWQGSAVLALAFSDKPGRFYAAASTGQSYQLAD
jgi:WD40 repeat protein|tara:strand:+ start:190 stop:1167 length:978 start_codon:yes stop_codon:yes gene_type:complete